MFDKILEFLGLKCKHKDKILVGHSYATYETNSSYDYSISYYTTETYRHFVCKKCHKHIEEKMVRYAPIYSKDKSMEFEERLRSKGILRIEDIVLAVDKVIYGESKTTEELDKNKTY